MPNCLKVLPRRGHKLLFPDFEARPNDSSIFAFQCKADFCAVIAISSSKTCEYSQSCHCFMTKDFDFVDFCASLTIAIIRIKLP
jgi:hypothetical protein